MNLCSKCGNTMTQIRFGVFWCKICNITIYGKKWN